MSFFRRHIVLPLMAFGMLALPTAAQAVITAGGATIHNAATLTFTGGTVTASVDVKALTVASAPTIAVNATTANVYANQSVTYTYTITNNANGTDTFSFTAASVDAGVAGAPGLNVNATGTVNTSLVLGGSITSKASTAGTIYIPAGSETNMAVGDTLNVGGQLYTIGSITAGTVASTTGSVTTPETPTAVALTPVGAAPAITAGSVAAGVQVGEVQSFNVVVTASSPSVAGVNGTHTVNLSGSTTAKTAGAAGAVVTYTTSAASANETVTTVLSPNVTLLKEVRNVTHAGTFSTLNVSAQSGDTLEYRLTATAAAGVGDATNNVLTDEVPPFTTYVPGSTTLNGVAVTDGAGGTLPLTAANGGLTINSTGAAAGTIVAGQSAVVIFQVTVN